MCGYATTPISGAYRPGVAVDDNDKAVAEALLAAIPGVNCELAAWAS